MTIEHEAKLTASTQVQLPNFDGLVDDVSVATLVERHLDASTTTRHNSTWLVGELRFVTTWTVTIEPAALRLGIGRRSQRNHSQLSVGACDVSTVGGRITFALLICPGSRIETLILFARSNDLAGSHLFGPFVHINPFGRCLSLGPTLLPNSVSDGYEERVEQQIG